MTKPSILLLALFSGTTLFVTTGIGGCTTDRVCDGGACEQPPDVQTGSSDDQPDVGMSPRLDAGQTQMEAGPDSTGSDHADASAPPPPTSISCKRDGECPDATVCSSELGRCVECTSDGHCTSQQQFCANTTPGGFRCVECVTHDHCGEGVCVDQLCRLCDPATSEGCAEGAPYCVEPTQSEAESDVVSLACVQCTLDEHCQQAPWSTCDNGACVVCDSRSNRGCEAPRSLCVADEAQTGPEPVRRCVECVGADDCSPEIPYCVDERCTECEPETGDGCDANEFWCLPPAHWGVSESADEVARCYECASHDDCTSDSLSRCIRGTCAECESDVDCLDPSASHCDLSTHECVPCYGPEQCAHLSETPVCLLSTEGDVASGRCVECTATERAACDNGASVCHTVPGDQQYQCVERGLGTLGVCRPCVSDADCADPSKCVAHTFGDDGWMGFYCLALEGADGAPEECEEYGRPFSVPLPTQSIDGVTGTYCAPFVTCPAYTDYLEKECDEDSDCGVPGEEDGVCAPHGSSTRCTYSCRGHLDCVEQISCNDDLRRVCSFSASP